MEQPKVERSSWIDATCRRVWQAITGPAELAKWFLPPVLGADMRRDANGNLIEIFEVKEAK
jgi:uncharacterized protein YndB with AHSA1/START domain